MAGRTKIDAMLASKIVWLDCFLTNVDRTVRNTNMLVWHKELWLIDHGAALYFHHSWRNWKEQSVKPFVQVKDHVLLPWAGELDEADRSFSSILTVKTIQSIVGLIPDHWLQSTNEGTPEEKRKVYEEFLINRLAHSNVFVKGAQDARQALI